MAAAYVEYDRMLGVHASGGDADIVVPTHFVNWLSRVNMTADHISSFLAALERP